MEKKSISSSKEDVSVDRTLLEKLVDPLLGLLSNAVEHGIESIEGRKKNKKILVGTIKLMAVHEEESVVITIEDDGRGLDLEMIKQVAYKNGLISQDMVETISDTETVNLITLPGFSTRAIDSEVTNKTLGLNAIKQRIESSGGTFNIENDPGSGVKFSVVMPTNMTIQRVLLFYVGSKIIATPSTMIQTIVSSDSTTAETYLGDTPLIRYRDEIIPLYDISNLIGLYEPYQVNYGIIFIKGNKKCCVKVSEILGFEEVVVKSSEGNRMLDLPWLAGMTILSDGEASPILDVWSLIHDNQ